jgi:hypothetical protein
MQTFVKKIWSKIKNRVFKGTEIHNKFLNRIKINFDKVIKFDPIVRSFGSVHEILDLVPSPAQL